MKRKFVELYTRMAILVSDMSYCTRRKVGCVIVKNDRVISMGYNGTPSGFPNCCETEEGTTKEDVLHAESNALMKLARSTESGENASLFVTTIPCLDCAKLIKQSGIKDVYYVEEYRCMKGKDFLIKCGITVTKVEL